MEQDDKVSAAALSLNPATSPARASRALVRPESALSEPGHTVSEPRAVAPEPEVESRASRAPEGTRAAERSSEPEPEDEAPEPRKSSSTNPKKSNNVRRIRIERMMSKAELARRANLSVLTIDRVERGYGCRMDTKRKILEALGLSLADRVRVFGEEE
jgi:DNA-binding XRE family transcriptional regulator